MTANGTKSKLVLSYYIHNKNIMTDDLEIQFIWKNHIVSNQNEDDITQSPIVSNRLVWYADQTKNKFNYRVTAFIYDHYFTRKDDWRDLIVQLIGKDQIEYWKYFFCNDLDFQKDEFKPHIGTFARINFYKDKTIY